MEGQIVQQEISHETTLFAEPIFHYGSFTFTNALLTSYLAVIILVVLAVILKKKLKEVPNILQNIFEIIGSGN